MAEPEASPLPRLLVAAPASGAGKTILAAALLRALRDRGLRPAAFKCGPDYIDPLFHSEAAGTAGRTLDLFFTDPETARALLRRGSAGADIAVLEGAMGLYDGIGETARASAWHVASETETPVVLAVRPKGAFLSLAAMVNGFAGFRDPSRLSGILLTQCSPALHGRLAPLLERETGLRVFGFLPDMPGARFPSRHLGLIAPEPGTGFAEKIALLASRAAETIDLDALVSLARSAPPLAGEAPALPAGAACRIAVARDAAFCFHYQDNLDMLEALGAELAYFSPLSDQALPDGSGGLYLCGGYPEAHARTLSENRAMRAAVAGAVAGGMPTLAEGGGFLYLQDTAQDCDGIARPLCGAVPGNGLKGDRLLRFGYIDVTTLGDGLLGPAGTRLKGHEFHYWDSDNPGNDCRAEKASGGRRWHCVHSSPALFAGFPQLFFRSNPDAAAHFVRAAAAYRSAGGRT